jgi:hypothetical protein
MGVEHDSVVDLFEECPFEEYLAAIFVTIPVHGPEEKKKRFVVGKLKNAHICNVVS